MRSAPPAPIARRGRFTGATHCINNHPFDADNTRIYHRPDGVVERKCKTCIKVRHTQQAARRKAERHSQKQEPAA